MGSGQPYGTRSLLYRSAIGLNCSSNTVAIGFGRLHYSCALLCLSGFVLDGAVYTAAFGPRPGSQHSVYTALAAPQPSASDDATGLVALAELQPPVPALVVSIRLVQP